MAGRDEILATVQSNSTMNKLEHFQQYKLRYEILFLLGYFFINNTLLATSVVMEAKRDGGELPFQLWEPFVWEYSSAISTLLLFPLLIYFMKRFPLSWQAISRSIFIYFIASIIFSACHVGIMVALREFVYFSQSMNYDFGQLDFELLYEYRKDLWGFIFLVAMVHAYSFIVSRLFGEANLIQEGETSLPATNIDRLLVKKLGKEFIIRVEDVQWLESSGNYVNLHIGERIYPLRSTLGKLSEQLESKGFCRIHRSHAIRLDVIESITPLSSGDSEVKLETGKVLTLSRRYKENFKAIL